MSMPKQQERLTRLGHILIDLSTVNAVAPIQGSAPEEGIGFCLVTTGGSIHVQDSESIKAVREQFYSETGSANR